LGSRPLVKFWVLCRLEDKSNPMHVSIAGRVADRMIPICAMLHTIAKSPPCEYLLILRVEMDKVEKLTSQKSEIGGFLRFSASCPHFCS